MSRDDQPRWHPMLAAVEPEPGVWVMVDTMNRPYGLVQIVRVDGQIRYRAEHLGELLGHATSLRLATERVHWAEQRTAVPGIEADPEGDRVLRERRRAWVEEITARYRR